MHCAFQVGNNGCEFSAFLVCEEVTRGAIFLSFLFCAAFASATFSQKFVLLADLCFKNFGRRRIRIGSAGFKRQRLLLCTLARESRWSKEFSSFATVKFIKKVITSANILLTRIACSGEQEGGAHFILGEFVNWNIFMNSVAYLLCQSFIANLPDCF